MAQVIVDGKPRRTSAKTEAEAKRKLRDLVRLVDDRAPIVDGNRTLNDLLTEWETKALPNRRIELGTLSRHRSSIKLLRADLGTKRLKTLTVDDIEAALAKRVDGGYAKASCLKLRTTLNLAMRWGERRGYVSRNVAAIVEIPANATPPRRGKAMTAEQADKFLLAAKGTPLEAMWVTMVYLGLRPGEAAGLSWDDIDFDNGIVHVRQSRKLDEHGRAIVGTTKTTQSVRSLDAPSAVTTALKAQRRLQKRQRMAVGPEWWNPDDLVFTSATGRPSDPSLCRKEFIAVISNADIGDGWTPNLLRHTTASLMADAGVSLELVADQLGHKDTRMASLHYRHRLRPTIEGGTVMAGLLGQGTR